MKRKLCGIVLALICVSGAQVQGAAERATAERRAGLEARWKPGEALIKFHSSADPLLATRTEAARLPAKKLPEILRKLHRSGSLVSLEPLGHPLSRGSLNKKSLLGGMYALRLARADTDIPALARELAGDPAIEFAEPNYELTASFTPDDPFFSSAGTWGQAYDDQWGVKIAQVPAAWDYVMGSNEIVVAVVDSGVDFSHPDLQGKVATNGWNFINNTADPADDFGHGTFCAGIIAAVVDNGVGIAGVCPSAKILPLKFLDSTGHGYSSSAASAINYAIQQGARIFNLSFSGPDSQTLHTAIDGAHINNAVLVASAGNNTNQVVDFPARYANVIAVGATDHADCLADFSNFGPRIDVVAPGGDSGSTPDRHSILSLRAANTSLGTPVDEIYTRGRGTSFSAAFVTGVVALMRAHQPRLQHERIRQILHTTADDVLAPGWDLQSGYGRVNALAALQPTNAVVTQITSPASFERVHGAIDIVGTASGIPFFWSVVEWGAGWAPKNWTLLASNSVRLAFTTLASWATSQVPDGEYTVRLRTADDAGNYEARVALTIYNQLYNFDPPMHQGWPQEDQGANASAPLAADLDGDSKAELLWAVRHSIVVTHANGTRFPGWPRGLVGSPRGPPSVADLDGDGMPEIGIISDDDSFAQEDPDTIYLWRSDGTIVSGWPKRFYAGDPFVVDDVSPVFGDIDGDGRGEVVWCSAATNRLGTGLTTAVHVDRYDGTPLPGWPVLLPDAAERTFTPPAVGDVDGDGRMDIVLLPFSGLLYLLNSSGQVMNGWPVTFAGRGTGLGSAPALVDLDSDGQLEIFAEAYSGLISAYKADGTLVPGWPQRTSGIAWPPAFGDLDGDGCPEIAVGVNGAEMLVFGGDGTRLPGWPPKYPAGWFMPPVIADLDGDGRLDVGSADRDGYVRAWNAAGEELYGMGFPIKATSDTCYSGPVLCDLTGTGLMNLVVLGVDNDHGCTYDVWDLNVPFNPSRAPHPTMLGDNAHQSRFQLAPAIYSISPVVVAADEPTEVTVWGNYYLKGMRVQLAGLEQSVISETVTSVVFQLSAGLAPGNYKVQVSNINSSATTSTKALMIVSSWTGDDDRDGLPNRWEIQHGTSPFDDGTSNSDNGPLGDPDHDGSVNLAEFKAGTDPQDPLSVLALKGAELSTSGALAISWSSVSGRTYSVHRATTIAGPFLVLTNGLPATPPLNSFLDDAVAGEAASFYRIGVNPPSP